MFDDLSAAFRPSNLLLFGTLAIPSAVLPDAAASVPLAWYEAGASSGVGLTGVRRVDGEPVGADAVLVGGGDGGGENFQDLYVRDADGNDVDPAGIAEVDISGGGLFDAGYDVFAESILFDYYTYYSFENVSEHPVHAALSLWQNASAEAVSTVSTATAEAGASAGGSSFFYIETAGGDTFDAAVRFSSDTIDALPTSDLSVSASSDGETSVSANLAYAFEILLEPGDTLHTDLFLTQWSGSLTNTAVAPVPLPAGAPLLLAALGGLAAARWWRNPARYTLNQ